MTQLNTLNLSAYDIICGSAFQGKKTTAQKRNYLNFWKEGTRIAQGKAFSTSAAISAMNKGLDPSDSGQNEDDVILSWNIYFRFLTTIL